MKSTILFAMTACAALVSGAANNGNMVPTLFQTTDTTAFAKSVSFVSSTLRGFISGYKKGMYKDSNYKVTDACFGKETQDLIVNVFDDWGTTKFDWGTEIVSVQKALLLITDNCEYDEALYQYLEFCY